MTKKDLIKSIKDRLYEGEVTLQYFKDTNKPEVIIQEQERSIDEIKEFLEYLKK